MADTHDESVEKKPLGKHAPAAGHGAGHGGGHEDHEEGHEGAPEWIISFADNTALMMGFFVILLALNMAPKGGGAPGAEGKGEPTAEQLDWAIGVRAGFNNPVRLDSTDPRDQRMIRRILEKKSQGQGLEPGVAGQGQRVQSIRPTDYHALSGSVSFDDGSVQLGPAEKQTILELADRLRGLRLMVEVRGHASAAEAFNQGDRAVQLSHDRAMAVAKVLSQQGVQWNQMRLVACGDNDRLQAQAYDAAQQRQNQRVEVIVTNELISPTAIPVDTTRH